MLFVFFLPHSSLRAWSLRNMSQNFGQYQCERFKCVMSTKGLASEEIEIISEHLLNRHMFVSKFVDSACFSAWP